MDPVFVLSPGRSGSTLLQRYLNCSPDLIVWGEHGGFIKGFRVTYENWCNSKHVQYLLNAEKKYADLLLKSGAAVGVDIEWTNSFTQDHLRENIAKLIAETFTVGVAPKTRWGFKEIRYGIEDYKFLEALFPSSQFVFIVRNPIDTLASAIVAFSKGQELWEAKTSSKENIEEMQSQINHWTNQFTNIANGIITMADQNMSYLVKYENLKDNPEQVVFRLCENLNIEKPSITDISKIKGDVRHGMKTSVVRSRLINEFANLNGVQNLIDTYKALGYNNFLSTQTNDY